LSTRIRIDMTDAEVHRFQDAVRRRLGLAFDAGRVDALADVIERRMEKVGVAETSLYLDLLGTPGRSEDEWRALAEGLTVSETYFFRDPAQFRALADLAREGRLREGSASRPFRVLSAGCASGEEAYSLAIVLGDAWPDAPAGAIELSGVDVSPLMIEKAERARYTSWSLRETPEDVRARFFRQEGRDYVLDPRIRGRAAFEVRNLVMEDAGFWQPERFDVIFCRNVIMYFAPDVARAVVDRLARSLAPGGWLFLGHAETLRGLSSDFHLRHTHGTFYYQRRRSRGERASPPAPSFAAGTAVEGRSAPAAAPSVDTSWFDAIRGASDRIAHLAGGVGTAPGDPPSTEAPAPPSERAMDLVRVLELLRQDRYSEALEAMRRLPADASGDPDALLLRAVLLTNCGGQSEAEGACRRLLERDELSAGAHYLSALCRERAGDLPGAMEHHQAAVYLDPAFAMPRLRLGMLERRAGAVESGIRDLEEALNLLAREDSSRILLFGGGFSREALVRLCRREIDTCGGQ
jgi:chemotaxis protein methyltransferase CheR